MAERSLCSIEKAAARTIDGRRSLAKDKIIFDDEQGLVET